MPFSQTQLRNRARDCRNIAKSTKSQVDRTMLEEIGYELEQEARKIAREERLKKVANAKPRDD
jgi:hypothetical protein